MFAKQCQNPSSGPPTDSTKLLEIQFELPFKLSSKSTMAVLKGQSWRILKSCYTGVGLQQEFPRYFVDGLNQSLALSVEQANGKRRK